MQLTDIAEAQDILARNMNQAIPATNSSLRNRTLDWSDEPETASSERDLSLVIVSDCSYNADSCPDLVRTLGRLSITSPGVKILIAMKRRHESEGIFFDLMRDAQMQMLEKAAIELPDEVYILGLSPPKIELYMYQYGRIKAA